MADRQSSEVDAPARRSNQERKKPRIAQLVERFMAEVNRFADEDWKKSDGWVGRLTLCDDEGKHTYVYEMKDGKMRASDSTGPFVAIITMSVDTFLDMVYAALSDVSSRAELAFKRKHSARHIACEGDRWILDSGRLRKVFQRMRSVTGGEEVGMKSPSVANGQKLTVVLQSFDLVARQGFPRLRSHVRVSSMQVYPPIHA